MNRNELQERIDRYSRLENNKDLQTTLEELDAFFGLDANIFTVLSSDNPNAKDFSVAKEGARAYRDALNSLKSWAENEMKQMEESEDE